MSCLSHDAIHKAVADLEEEMVKRLVDLVNIGSLLDTPEEEKVQTYMASFLEELGLHVDRWDAHMDEIKDLPGFSPPASANLVKNCVVGTHTPKTEAAAQGKSLILNGHVDVVPTGPPHMWTTPPFAASVREGRLYGRGAGDMKAGVVAMCLALKALRTLGFAPAGRVHVMSVLDEECTGNGTLACLAKGYRADGCVIPEPFPSIMTAQMGVMWLELTVSGRPAHVLDTSAGSNAIETMMVLYQGLKELEEQWNRPEVRPPVFASFKHPINFNLGIIHGGQWASTVPAECVASVRVGFAPGMTMAEARAAVQETLQRTAAAKNIQFSVRYYGFAAEGCEMDAACPLLAALGQAHAAMAGAPAAYAPVTCTTDARFFQLYYGIPATCYGPEYTRNIHGIDESVSLDAVQRTVAVLARFVADWCGLERLS